MERSRRQTRRERTLESDGVLTNMSRSTGQTTGPKGDKGDKGDTGAAGAAGAAGATGATGADGTSALSIIYYADFSDGISGSTGVSGATGALTVSSTYTTTSTYYPHNVIFHQTAASTNSNASTTAVIYLGGVAITATATLSSLTGTGTFQCVNCTGGPVATGTQTAYALVTGNFESVKVYLYAEKLLTV